MPAITTQVIADRYNQLYNAFNDGVLRKYDELRIDEIKQTLLLIIAEGSNNFSGGVSTGSGANQSEIKAAIESATNLNELEQLLRDLATEATLIEVKNALNIKPVYPIDQPTLAIANSNQVYSRNFSNVCWINFLCRENTDISWHYLANKVNTSNAYTLLAGNTGKLEFGERKWSGSLYFLSTTAGANLEIWGYSYDENVIASPPPLDYSTLDPDVQTYRNNILSYSSTINDSSLIAIDTFVKTLKNNNLWTKIRELAPLAGNNLSSARVLLKTAFGDTVNLSEFSTSDYSEVTGIFIQNNKKFDIRLAPSTYLSTGDHHLSLYAANITATNTPTTLIGGKFSHLGDAQDYDNNLSIKVTNLNIIGITCRPTTGTTNANYNSSPGLILLSAPTYNNRILSISKTNQLVTNNSTQEGNFNSTYLSAGAEKYREDNGSTATEIYREYSNYQLRFYSIGTGFTSTEIPIFNNAVQTLMQSLGRGV
ncbi:hypothetical protein [Scytonema sp. NUACC26]|uniref:hypothetical protein n=1 Tax=Scytonema sp. NUACC26 TaxID=3140176 RepID=UPI0034DBA396